MSNPNFKIRNKNFTISQMSESQKEEFYRKIANNSISGYNLFRNLSNLEFKENESSKALKKLILVNSNAKFKK